MRRGRLCATLAQRARTAGMRDVQPRRRPRTSAPPAHTHHARRAPEPKGAAIVLLARQPRVRLDLPASGAQGILVRGESEHSRQGRACARCTPVMAPPRHRAERGRLQRVPILRGPAVRDVPHAPLSPRSAPSGPRLRNNSSVLLIYVYCSGALKITTGTPVLGMRWRELRQNANFSLNITMPFSCVS